MIPSVLAKQLKTGLEEYIETTFPMTNVLFKGTMKSMLKEKNAIYHEPYFSIPLPFRVAEEETVKFNVIIPEYKLYLHQQRAFERLLGEYGRSTLIATGTGSGKTECFIYSILEYCYRHIGEPGIKALIIYPMNALASDQAKRLAKLIYNNPKLKNNISAGMYVGGYEKDSSHEMTKDRIITNHEAMIENPPDILLTNYKMLDYLLIRPKDARLWEENKADTLKYIAVDELHTFDGAQGTDLACLLRRLKARLGTKQDYLCCIGTSATMGTKDSVSDIKNYAAGIFGETFEDDSVITEDRLSPLEFFQDHGAEDFTFPSNEQCEKLQLFLDEDDVISFLFYSVESWIKEKFDKKEIMSGKTRLEIGRALMKHSFIQYMITVMDGNYIQMEYLIEELKNRFPELSKLKNPEIALDGLFALISHSRVEIMGQLRPFLNIMVQFWVKELRRFLGKVSEKNINYAIEADLNEEQAKHYLPIVNCRDCGETGWAGIANMNRNMTMTNLETFYNLYFSSDTKIKMLFPYNGKATPDGMVSACLCADCLQLDINQANNICSSCGKKSIPVLLPLDNISKDRHKGFICPFCGSKQGLSLIGLRSATIISAQASQLYSSNFNDDKKLLAFSDNVQDAAHRAGFFNYRTWKSSLRTAIQTFALNAKADMSLSNFQSEFVRYWHDNLTREEFVSLFIAPNMTWKRAYERMLADGTLGFGKEAKQLLEQVEKRVQYEIMLEYGLGSRIGRTLEKSGCSVLSCNNEGLENIVKTVRERVVNELGILRDDDLNTFRHMLIGFLYQMKSKGAFNDNVFKTYIKEKGKNYMLTNKIINWMPGMKSGRNTPRFIYKPKGIRKRILNFDNIELNTKYSHWIRSCIDDILLSEDIPKIICEIILDELEKGKIITKMASPDDFIVYALDKSEITISTKVTQFTCDKCGANISASQDNSIFWDKASCLQNNCNGRLYENKKAELGYYGKLYSNANSVRIIAKEHTGLLQRDKREELEKIFKRSKEDSKPWDVNFLSSTPTLEMGIDIGDLSSIILCSMPPGQAQYLQRIGRAGRKDGNALTITIANAQAHDLYFYTEPLEMIQGIVEPPQIFLQAPAVLERQFLAYCMDNWVKGGTLEDAIPSKMGKCLNNLDKRQTDIFPFNFLNYVDNNLIRIVQAFVEMFNSSDDKLSEETMKGIRKYAIGEGIEESPMQVKILDAFIDLKNHKEALQKDINELSKLKKEIESKPYDSSFEEEIEGIKNERSGLYSVKNSIDNKSVFAFMSDEGLLPNYAFPEAGMVLKAVLYRKEERDDGKRKKYEKMFFEYNRNAASAISEFAPANSFYVDGKKLQINRVDVNTTNSVDWRLCPNCSHGEEYNRTKNTASCPNCGSVAWADAGQIRPMLKVKMVYSNMPYEEAQISDESDNRRNVFYCKQLFVDVDEENDIEKAFQMGEDDFPFGYEFVRKAKLREINFGEKCDEGENLMVSGVEEKRKGFKICKYCGYIQPKRGEAKHTFTCPARNKKNEMDPYEECLFLYREFETEVLRVLIPATTEDYSKKIQESFTAAFMLGLEKYFGNVDHLNSTISEAPIMGESYQKQYLVVYDTVPGGTGYLKQLMQDENSLIQILEKALDVLENCSCRNEVHKDGCYRCLFAYRLSRNLGEISRKTAIRLLRRILKEKDNIKKIDGLKKLPANSLFESELEQNFIAALKYMESKNRNIEVSTILVNSKKGYLLNIGKNVWDIEPQVTLGGEDGVSVRTRADFVFWPRKRNEGHKPVAIYTDGYTYHKDKVEDDTLKREAIRRSGKYRVWTLSRKDVLTVIKKQEDFARKMFLYDKMPSADDFYHRIINDSGVDGLKLHDIGAMELLMQYLERTNSEELFKIHAKALAFSLLDSKKLNDENAFKRWHSSFKESLDAAQFIDYDFLFGKCFFGSWSPSEYENNIDVFSGIDFLEMKEKKGKALPTVIAVLMDKKNKRTDKYEEDWNGFWHFYNLMQFLDNFVGLSRKGVEEMTYNALPVLDFYRNDFDKKPIQRDQWTEIKELLFDDEAVVLVNKLQKAKAKIPTTVSYALVDDKGTVIAECELAWPYEKVAALLSYGIHNKEILEKEGWIVFTLDDDIPPIIKGGDI